MSCYRIYVDGGQKMCQIVRDAATYRQLRNGGMQVATVREVRMGLKKAKRRLMQFNYSCLPSADMHLRGCKTPSTTVGMDVDFDGGDTSATAIEEHLRRIMAMKDEIGLLMLERSVSKGFHMVFRRRDDMTQEENLRWASEKIGCEYDTCAKDITRVFYATTASPDDLIYLDDALFENKASSAPCEPAGTPPTPRTSAPSAAATQTPAESEKKNGRLVDNIERQMGGAPTEGNRNNFVFRMACKLRRTVGSNREAIAALMPSYGLTHDEVMACIDSALTYADTEATDASTTSAADDTPQTPMPPMPDKLPPLIELLVSRTPDVYRPAVATAVFPPLASHLWQTRFRYIDNVDHEATLMCVLMAGTGAGKSCIAEPIRHIMADIVERDEINRAKEKAWKDDMNSKGANKDKKRRPEGLVIQCVKSDMTNAAFVQRMKEAEGRFLYTQMNEIEQFDALKTSSRSRSHFQIMCLAFDPGNSYGTERVGTMSVSETVCIRFNWNASTTISKGQKYFGTVLTDGPVSRINFCTIPEREIGAEMPVYGSYDESFDTQLRPYIDRLCNARGLITSADALMLARKLSEENADFARLSQSRVYENLSFRANVIAFLKAMVLYVAHGQTWSKEMEDFIRWSEQYDLWCKMQFFGTAIEDAERVGKEKKHGHPKSMLCYLKEVFTTDELDMLRKRLGLDKTPSYKLLKVWKDRKYIEATDDGRWKILKIA